MQWWKCIALSLIYCVSFPGCDLIIIRWKHWLSSLLDWVFQVKLCVFIADISMIHTSLQYLDWKNSKVFPSLHYIICVYFVKQNNLISLKPIICVLGSKIPLTFALTCKFLNALCCCNMLSVYQSEWGYTEKLFRSNHGFGWKVDPVLVNHYIILYLG